MILSEVKTHWSHANKPYLGPELRPHFILETQKIWGSAVMAWVGPCEVKTEHLVDWEDRLENDFIRAKAMVHFLGEFFGAELFATVGLQRLFASIVVEVLRADYGLTASRSGDDVFMDTRKMSVSIVTASPVSTLLHFGVNVDPEGAPVAAVGLLEFKIEPSEFAKKVLERFKNEYHSMALACTKVRPVV
jgi:hypothetical protein